MPAWDFHILPKVLLDTFVLNLKTLDSSVPSDMMTFGRSSQGVTQPWDQSSTKTQREFPSPKPNLLGLQIQEVLEAVSGVTVWKVICSLLLQRSLKVYSTVKNNVFTVPLRDAVLSFIGEVRKSGPCPVGFTVLGERSSCR